MSCCAALEVMKAERDQQSDNYARALQVIASRDLEMGYMKNVLRQAMEEMEAMERLHNGYYASLESIKEVLKDD